MQRQWHAGTLPESARECVTSPSVPIDWQPVHPAEGPAAGRATTTDGALLEQGELALGALPAGQLLLPSYCATGTRYGYRFSLHAKATAGSIVASLAGVGDPPPYAGAMDAATAALPCVATPIDVFEVQAPLTEAVLRIVRWCERAPEFDWLAVSTRPSTLLPPAPLGAAKARATAPRYSQRRLDPGRRDRTCSPVCLAMAATALGVPSPRSRYFAASWHSGMFGVWPANLHAASRVGIAGVLLTIGALDELVPWLDAGAEIIVSTRWAAGELDDAATASSGGHLMLLRGFDRHWVWVHDPAANDDGTVARRYRREQFDRIAIASRGVVYVLLPAAPTRIAASRSADEPWQAMS